MSDKPKTIKIKEITEDRLDDPKYPQYPLARCIVLNTEGKEYEMTIWKPKKKNIPILEGRSYAVFPKQKDGKWSANIAYMLPKKEPTEAERNEYDPLGGGSGDIKSPDESFTGNHAPPDEPIDEEPIDEATIPDKPIPLDKTKIPDGDTCKGCPYLEPIQGLTTNICIYYDSKMYGRLIQCITENSSTPPPDENPKPEISKSEKFGTTELIAIRLRVAEIIAQLCNRYSEKTKMNEFIKMCQELETKYILGK